MSKMQTTSLPLKGKWFTSYNPMAGYIATRVLDTSEPVHSGNVEYSCGYSKNKADIDALVEELNKVSEEEIKEIVKRYEGR